MWFFAARLTVVNMGSNKATLHSLSGTSGSKSAKFLGNGFLGNGIRKNYAKSVS